MLSSRIILIRIYYSWKSWIQGPDVWHWCQWTCSPQYPSGSCARNQAPGKKQRRAQEWDLVGRKVVEVDKFGIIKEKNGVQTKES